MHTIDKIAPPRNLDEYLANTLERLHEAGKPVAKILEDFEKYKIPPAVRNRLILESPYGQDPKIKGVIELFGSTCLTE